MRASAVIAIVFTAGLAALAREVRADVVADRTAVRFVTAETGGNAKPRFITERELAFYTRLEALLEGVTLGPTEYPDRYVRAATDRLVARAMLASLLLQRGTEPPDLPKLTNDMRAELEDRLGGAPQLAAVMEKEKIDEAELLVFMKEQVRANWYIDTSITPIIAVTDDQLRETFRGQQHPYKTAVYDEVKPRLKRWLVAERARVSELEFLQGTRARIKVTVIEAPAK